MRQGKFQRKLLSPVFYPTFVEVECDCCVDPRALEEEDKDILRLFMEDLCPIEIGARLNLDTRGC